MIIVVMEDATMLVHQDAHPLVVVAVHQIVGALVAVTASLAVLLLAVGLVEEDARPVAQVHVAVVVHLDVPRVVLVPVVVVVRLDVLRVVLVPVAAVALRVAVVDVLQAALGRVAVDVRPVAAIRVEEAGALLTVLVIVIKDVVILVKALATTPAIRLVQTLVIPGVQTRVSVPVR